MMRLGSFRLLYAITLFGCASTAQPVRRSAADRGFLDGQRSPRARDTVGTTGPDTTSNPTARVSSPVEPVAVRAVAPEPLEFTITASSDLPVEPVSTAQPYERIVERSVSPLRAALAECLRALGAPARRVVRVTIEEDGRLLPRPPQEYALSARDARCVEGILRAATVEPSPPRVIPYDIRVEVSR